MSEDGSNEHWCKACAENDMVCQSAANFDRQWEELRSLRQTQHDGVKTLEETIDRLMGEIAVAYLLISCGTQMDLNQASEWMKRNQSLITPPEPEDGDE